MLGLVSLGTGQIGNTTPSTIQQEEDRGRQIYLRGTSPTGQKITAVMGNSGLEIPGEAMACVNCHGRDGRGKPEGGVTPSDITWNGLTKPYGVSHESGRNHPPYTEKTLKRAITMGLDPAGNQLHPAMPRFRLSQTDITDLIAYIKKIDEAPEPGLNQSSIRVGTLLIKSGPFAETTRSINVLLRAYFDSINKSGGIFNREINLQIAESDGLPEQRVQALRTLLEDGNIFALTGAFTSGADREIALLASDRELPLVGAITETPDAGFPINRYVFYIHAGLQDQARSLAIFAAGRKSSQSEQAVIINSGDRESREAAEAIKSECRRLKWGTLGSIEIPRSSAGIKEMVQELMRNKISSVFYLGPKDMQREFLDQAGNINWFPDILIPGPLLARESLDAPESVTSHLFISLSTLPSDLSRESISEYKGLAETYSLPTTELESQLTAFAAAKILVEGLKRAGRDLTRQKLIETLDQFYQFETGVTPPITFGPNRRVGSSGAHIVSVNKKEMRFIPVTKWIEVD